MKGKKIEPWRIVAAAVSVVFIIGLWVSKDISSIYATTPIEDLLPMIVTTVAVTLLKVVGIATVVFLAKWIIEKIKKRHQ